MATEYWALSSEVDSVPRGIFRFQRDEDGLPSKFEYLDVNGRWKSNYELARFLYFGELGAEPVSDERARELIEQFT